MKIRAIFRKQFNAQGEGTDYPTDFFRPSYELEDMTFIEMRPPVPAQVTPETGEHRCMCGCGCVAPLPAETLICAGCLESDDEAHEISLYGEEEWEYETEHPDAIESDLDRCETCISYSRQTAEAA